MTEDDNETQRGMTRREWMKVMAVAGLAATGGIGAAPSGGILKRKIPKSGELLPAIGLGTSRTFDTGDSEADRAPRREVLEKFVEEGGTLVDSSPMYGRAEQVIGDLAAELKIQDKLFYATKVWIEGREAGIGQMEQSMRRMRTKRIDLMQIHNLVDWETQLATLVKWKAQKKIRYIGITHYQVSYHDDLAAILRKRKEFDFVQFNYSMDTREAEKTLLPLCADLGIATLINRPFEKAGLFGRVMKKPLPPWAADFDCTSWAQYFLKYILAEPAVTCAIPATRNPKHLVDNMRAGYGRLPDAKQRQQMVEYLETL